MSNLLACTDTRKSCNFSTVGHRRAATRKRKLSRISEVMRSLRWWKHI